LPRRRSERADLQDQAAAGDRGENSKQGLSGGAGMKSSLRKALVVFSIISIGRICGFSWRLRSHSHLNRFENEASRDAANTLIDLK
jgi:hypothetical protein